MHLHHHSSCILQHYSESIVAANTYYKLSVDATTAGYSYQNFTSTESFKRIYFCYFKVHFTYSADELLVIDLALKL